MRQEQIDGALAYARADKSDPFAFNRAISHIKNGIASIRAEKGPWGRKAGEDAYYSADPVRVPRDYVGHPRGAHPGEKRQYAVEEYRNIRRP